MSDNAETLARRPPGRPVRDHARKHIPLPNGDELWPRAEIAAALDISGRTLQRMHLPVLMHAGCAFHPYREVLRVLADRIKRPGEPSAKRRGGRGE
jgi:hypothetical protein